MSPHDALDIQTLAQRAHWVRGLARALVADQDEADDVAQEAWLASLRSSPRHESSWRAWIAGVVRNLARGRRRKMLRRGDSERESARVEPESPPETLLEKLEIHEQLVAAVRRLDEPYRTAILMRYFEELSPDEIARRTQTPVRTVHTRLVRGLAQLRVSFDVQHGRRDAWTALLLPFAYPHPAALAGAVVVNAKVKIAVVVLVLAGAYLAVRQSAKPADVVGAAAESDLLARPKVADFEPKTTPERVYVDSEPHVAQQQAVDAVKSAASDEAVGVCRGMVVDVDGRPRANVEVALRKSEGRDTELEPFARTDERGIFEAPAPEGFGALVAVDPRLVTVLRSQHWHESTPNQHTTRDATPYEHTIVVADAIQVAGRVIAANGAPIPAAMVVFTPRSDLRARLERVLDRTTLVEWSATTDDAGRFEFASAPAIASSHLTASAKGFVAATLTWPTNSQFDLTLRLEPSDVSSPRVYGRVLDEAGEPIADALVALVGGPVRSTERTNSRGEFDLALSKEDAPATELCALAPGRGMKFVRPLTPSVLDADAWPLPLDIVLDEHPLEIRGVVLDADGRPVPLARIATLDGHSAGLIEVNRGGTRFFVEVDIERFLADSGSLNPLAADELGRFALRGLLPRAYRIEAYDRDTLASVVSPPIEAGTHDIELRLPREDVWPRVAGTVVDGSGEPVAKARVWLTRDSPRLSKTASRGAARDYRSDDFTTDEQGRFEFKLVARATTRLTATPPGPYSPVELSLANAIDVQNLRIVVRLQCHVQVDLSGSSVKGTSIGFENAAGETLDILIQHAEVSFGAKSVMLSGSLSEVMIVGDDAVMLVLDGAGGETTRVPIKLKRDELNVIRP